MIMPVIRKERVAEIDRIESLPIPQTACPLVHPFARETPIPTIIPVTA